MTKVPSKTDSEADRIDRALASEEADRIEAMLSTLVHCLSDPCPVQCAISQEREWVVPIALGRIDLALVRLAQAGIGRRAA